MADFNLFVPLFARIDSVTDTYVSEMSSAAATAIAPVVTAGLTLTFIAFGLLIARGGVQMPLSEFLGKSIRIGLIVGAALGSGLYQGEIADAIKATPDALATALLPSEAKGQSAAQMIDVAGQAAFLRASEAWEMFDNLLDPKGYVFLTVGVIIMVASAILIGLGGAFLLLAKLGLAVLAGLGPIFIVSMLWQSTSRLFEAWVGQIVNYSLLVVVFAAVLGLSLDIFGSFVDSMKFDGVQNVAFNVGALIILTLAFVVAFLQLPALAAALGAGAAVAGLYEMRAVAGGAKGAVVGGMRNASATAAGIRAHHAAHSAGASPREASAAGREAASAKFRGRKAA